MGTNQSQFLTPPPRFDHSLFLGPVSDIQDGQPAPAVPSFTPALAKRTKQEIRNSVKIAARYAGSPLLWAKCLLATSYSIWFIHLPSMALHDNSKAGGVLPVSAIRAGYTTLQRMQRLRLHPVDEICYRVLMQLCGLYTQPVIAVKVLFEMKRHGVNPNAVTYGYYNKAVLESEWPQGIASSSQMLWHKLRNVQTAVWLFRQAGKTRRRRKAQEEDAVSRASLESGPGAEFTVPAVREEADGRSTGSREECSGEEAKLGSHSDVGYASMTEVPTTGEQVEVKVADQVDGVGEGKVELERQRSYSIVRPPAEDAEMERNTKELDIKEEDELEEEKTAGPVKYKVIKNLFPEPTNLRRDSNTSANLEEQVRGWTEDASRAGSEAPTTTSQRSVSCDSLERLESLPGSPAKGDTTPVAARPGSFLEKVAVTADDPLGALATSPGDLGTTPREKVSGSEPLSQRSQSLSDVLGEPFSPTSALSTPAHTSKEFNKSASLVMQRYYLKGELVHNMIILSQILDDAT